ncbi:FeoB-associated Cys-rich membrane protein [Ancylomarina longa]|uniref:FeoB-associated Cys-rich membrane protein n=1 Tax=Ancylomarina longa TaxID=2487017 RepID=A0A434AXG0_9BACT|nr:FeoB-associated Cys-rich membrane protein [Ancylomarina longa]
MINFQLIATYIIVGSAAFYSIYQFIKLILKQDTKCGGCSSCSFKNELRKKKLTTSLIQKNHNFTYIKN